MALKRADKRAYNALRPLHIDFDGLDRVDGSARFGFGETKALASVSGPIEVRLASEQASKATFEVIVRPLSGVAGTESKSLSSSIRNLLTPSLLLSHNPRTLIQLVVQSLTPLSSPSRTFLHPTRTAVLINASSLALLNAASFPMRGIVCAVGVGRLPGASTTLLLDPAEDELALLDGGGTFAFLFAAGPDSGGEVKAELVWSEWRAVPFREEEIVQARRVARAGAEEVWRAMKCAVGSGFAHRVDSDVKAKSVKVSKDDDDEMEIA